MARQFNGTSEQCEFGAGNVAGVHEWGTIAVLFKRDGTSSGAWRCPIYSGTGGTSDWGMSFDINTGNVMWFGLGTGESTGSTSLFSTVNYYVVIAVKPNGAGQTVRFHVRSMNMPAGTFNAWAHSNGSGTVSNATLPTVSEIVLGSFAGFDHFNGDICAAAIFEGWAPNDAAVEAISWHAGAQHWKDAGDANAPGAYWFVSPGQAATSIPIQDLSGGGGHETTLNVGTVAPDPTGWDNTIVSDDIEFECTINGTSSVTATMQVAKELEATIDGTSNFQGNLRVGKELSATIAATSSFTGEMEVANEMEATISGTSDFTGQLVNGKVLFAIITENTSDFVGQLSAPVNLECTISGSSDFEGTLPLGNDLVCTISSTSGTQAELMVEKELACLIEGSSNFSGKLDLGFKSPFVAALQVVTWGRNRWFDPQFIDGSVPHGDS